MAQFRISEAAELLGVSPDTVRRAIESGVLASAHDIGGRMVVDGVELARHAVHRAKAPLDSGGHEASARNRLVGLITGITVDTVMAQVEMQCGPYRVVSLLSREAVEDLGLEIGQRAVAVMKATTVVVEVPRHPDSRTRESA